MATRRQVLIAGAVGAMAPGFALAQSPRPRIGMLLAVPLKQSVLAPIVVQRLAQLGYQDGKGVTLIGVLFGFGAVSQPALRRTAEIGVAILKGAKPPSIPVEQPCEYEFTINSKAAAEMGLTIPPPLLARATRILQ